MNIGIIGAGNIGGTLGRLFAAAGHSVVFGTRTPERVPQDGARVRSASVSEAIDAGDCVVFAGPYGAWPDFARDHGRALAGKPIADAANPYPERDGWVAENAARFPGGSGAYTASLLPPGVSLVKTFNTIYWVDLRDKAHRAPTRLAMPIAGDAPDALAVFSRLADDAGFDPVVVGPLDDSGLLDAGSAVYAKSLTAAGVRSALNLPSAPQESTR
jgi:predicted dinucleotide-binding enzyme